MSRWELFAFVVYPYVCLSVFAVGHLYRYRKDLRRWNPKSTELLEKRSLRTGIYLFHAGVLLTLVGHAGGLLIPQSIYDSVGISGTLHSALAIYLGLVFGLPAFAGNLLLLWRRLYRQRIRAVSDWIQYATLGLLLLTIGAGMYNVVFARHYILDTVAPWIRSIVVFAPQPHLMAEVPISYKIHVWSAFLLFGFSPFTRLVHIWSVPLSYLRRRYILFRRHAPQLYR